MKVKESRLLRVCLRCAPTTAFVAAARHLNPVWRLTSSVSPKAPEPADQTNRGATLFVRLPRGLDMSEAARSCATIVSSLLGSCATASAWYQGSGPGSACGRRSHGTTPHASRTADLQVSEPASLHRSDQTDIASLSISRATGRMWPSVSATVAGPASPTRRLRTIRFFRLHPGPRQPGSYDRRHRTGWKDGGTPRHGKALLGRLDPEIEDRHQRLSPQRAVLGPPHDDRGGRSGARRRYRLLLLFHPGSA